MLNVMQSYSNDNPEKFNKDFIYLKKNDPILPYLDHICKALEIIDGVTYLGSEINTDESTFVLKKVVESDDEPTSDWMSIDESRLNLITLRFKIEKEDNNVRNKDKVDADGIRRENIELKILFPKLINDFYYVINGTKYYPIYQIIDAGTYTTNSGALPLKSLFMPIVIRNKSLAITDTNGNKHNGRFFLIDLFKNKTNILYYLYAKFGLEESIKFLLQRDTDLTNQIDEDDIGNIITLAEEPCGDDDFYSFKINNKLYVEVYAEMFDNNQYVKDVTFTVVNSLNNKKIRFGDEDYWKKNLGRIFATNTNAQLDKAQKTLLSFERIMDECTKENLRIDLDDKNDTYSIVRWMMVHYDRLSKLDNMDLKNKRIRLNEYLINPLLMKFSSNTYRALNSRSMTFSNIRTIFSNIGPNFIIRKLVKNELLRYSGAVNTIDLFNSALKVSFRGPQSFADGSSSIEDKYRTVHPSYIGKIGLCGSSNSDPGMSATFSPFIETDPDNPFYFVTEEEYRQQFEF